MFDFFEMVDKLELKPNLEVYHSIGCNKWQRGLTAPVIFYTYGKETSLDSILVKLEIELKNENLEDFRFRLYIETAETPDSSLIKRYEKYKTHIVTSPEKISYGEWNFFDYTDGHRYQMYIYESGYGMCDDAMSYYDCKHIQLD